MGTGRSYAQHSFSQVPQANIARSVFDRSHGVKTAFDAGWLIPIWADEALPGDTIDLTFTHFARLATPLHPVMDNMFIDTFFFAVPNRLIWDNWEKFCGAQDSPGDSTDYLLPQVTVGAGGFVANQTEDYLGVPPNIAGVSMSAMWHRAIALTWNEWFRDENLQIPAGVPKTDGPDLPSYYGIRPRGKRKDYFTGCLPWPQKGPSVELSFGGTAPVQSDGTYGVNFTDGTNTEPLHDSAVNGAILGLNTLADNTNLAFGSVTGLEADLSSATAQTINEIRQAVAIQQLYERDARGGTRYTETIKSHFGVTSPDFRLQRPEYLGGGTTPLTISTVPQQSESGSTPQGNLAGFGISSATHSGFVKSFTEHCTLIGLACLRADLNYQQGMERQFSRRTRWDFFWPGLAQIGEQAVLNKEIFVQGSAGGTADDEVFGYQERFAEYRHKPSIITGKMRSDASGSLDVWHLAQDFASLPVLDSTFIQETPPIDRIIAVPAEPHCIFDGYFKVNAVRPIPVHGVPGIDRF